MYIIGVIPVRYQSSRFPGMPLVDICGNHVDVVNVTVPKVITNREGIGVYLTRAVVPCPKGRLDHSFYKQVCVYGFRPEALEFYCDYGMRYGKAKAEEVEDIEILCFIENGYRVQYIEVDSDTVAVDTQKDLEKVRELSRKKINKDQKNICSALGGRFRSRKSQVVKPLSYVYSGKTVLGGAA